MPTVQDSTPVWSSRLAFYLATVGGAVGLGSIWRMPYLVGSNGGSAFISVFVLACLMIATPLLVAEFPIGRRVRHHFLLHRDCRVGAGLYLEVRERRARRTVAA